MAARNDEVTMPGSYAPYITLRIETEEERELLRLALRDRIQLADAMNLILTKPVLESLERRLDVPVRLRPNNQRET